MGATNTCKVPENALSKLTSAINFDFDIARLTYRITIDIKSNII